MGVKIIAEAGVNHNGSLKTAKQMVLAAKEAGADYVKFQTFCPEKLVSKYADKAEYQKQATGAKESQLEMLGRLALSQEDFKELKEYCSQQGIGFLSTPFDIESIHFLDKLGMDFWKLPSGELTNLPYLLEVAKTGKPVVMSTGMSRLEEVKASVDALQRAGAGELTLLHCNTEYPTPMGDVNLRAMAALHNACSLPVGYSDHTLGIEIPIAAAALGASVIEKHFTLNKNLIGNDHYHAGDPNDFKKALSNFQWIDQLLGSGIKTVLPCEIIPRQEARRSLVLTHDMKQGDILTQKDIMAKRPGTGISPEYTTIVLGRTLKRDLSEDTILTWEMV